MKNFFEKNKALLVIILALLVGGANLVFGPMIVEKTLQLVEIPVATQTLPEGTKITEDMVTTISTSREMLPHGIYINKEDIVGTYVSQNCLVPENGFFYAELISDEITAMGSSFVNLDQGKTAYTIEIDDRYTSNDSLKVGQYINIYFSSSQTQTLPMIGLMDETVKIINLNNDGQKTLITLSIDELEVGLYVGAEKLGVLIPLVYSESNAAEVYATEYDMETVRNHILSAFDIPTVQNETGENTGSVE